MQIETEERLRKAFIFINEKGKKIIKEGELMKTTCKWWINVTEWKKKLHKTMKISEMKQNWKLLAE